MIDKMQCQGPDCHARATIVNAFRFRVEPGAPVQPPINVWSNLGREFWQHPVEEHRRGFIYACGDHAQPLHVIAHAMAELGTHVHQHRVTPCRDCNGTSTGPTLTFHIGQPYGTVATTSECVSCEGTGIQGWPL